MDNFPALRAELEKLGYSERRIDGLIEAAGIRLRGDAHGMLIRKGGREEYLSGPFVAVTAKESEGTVSATVVRWG